MASPCRRIRGAAPGESAAHWYPAGVVLPWHTHPVINAAVIVRGTLALNLKDGTTRVFYPGEAIVE